MLNRTIYLLCSKHLRRTTNSYLSATASQVLCQSHGNPKQESKPSFKTNSKNELEFKQYFVKNDPDVFGTFSSSVKEIKEKNPPDEGDVKEETFLENPVPKSKKLSTKKYADVIKSHIRKRQIKEAIDVLEVRMLQEDRVKPENYIYNLLMGACGRVGYTKKAFKLFNDMKKRGLQPTGGTYTALFNACSNSPWIDDGLSRATKLRQLMQEKGVIPNDTNYNAMIKAFGRCGDLKTAFSLVDEMIENKIVVKEDTINFLLQSCISDKEAGFRHALLVWRKFHQKNIQPDIFSFNLMLRCIRDCNLGDVEKMNNLLQSSEFRLLNGQKLVEKANSSKKRKTDGQKISNRLQSADFLPLISKELYSKGENHKDFYKNEERMNDLAKSQSSQAVESQNLHVGEENLGLYSKEENTTTVCNKNVETENNLLQSQDYIPVETQNLYTDRENLNMDLKKVNHAEFNKKSIKGISDPLQSQEFQTLEPQSVDMESEIKKSAADQKDERKMNSLEQSKTEISAEVSSTKEKNQNHLQEQSKVVTFTEKKMNVCLSKEKSDILSEEKNVDSFNWPNLMAATPYLGKLVKLTDVTKPEDRLLLVGGYSGFLKNMQGVSVKPDIKTFTQLLDCIPGTVVAEKALLASMKKEGVKYDVDFLNMLIKKRSMRFDYAEAKEVMKMFRPPKLRPDIVTYGVLALGCQTKEEAEQLLIEMSDGGYRSNAEILGAMLKQASCHMNFYYVLYIMELTLREKIKPNKIFMQHLDDLYEKAKEESKKNTEKPFVKSFKLFRMRYKTWLNETKVDTTDDVHPWEQFRKPTETNVKYFKDTEVHFKPRIKTRYRQKTGPLNKIV